VSEQESLKVIDAVRDAENAELHSAPTFFHNDRSEPDVKRTRRQNEISRGRERFWTLVINIRLDQPTLNGW
jgi:hypothetical protein